MIRLLLLDVDGTLTDGTKNFLELDGGIYESKSFHIHDGLGIVAWLSLGARLLSSLGESLSHCAKELVSLGSHGFLWAWKISP